MKTKITAAALCLLASVAHASSIDVSSTEITDLGTFAAGTYRLTGSGVIDLCGTNEYAVNPDGSTQRAVSCLSAVPEFHPGPFPHYMGTYGPAGDNAGIGALIVTLNSSATLETNPSESNADLWQLVGYGAYVTLQTAGHIYAAVNDVYYSNNRGMFQITVEPVNAVPEPATASLLLGGLLGITAFQRRRKGAHGDRIDG